MLGGRVCRGRGRAPPSGRGARPPRVPRGLRVQAMPTRLLRPCSQSLLHGRGSHSCFTHEEAEAERAASTQMWWRQIGAPACLILEPSSTRLCSIRHPLRGVAGVSGVFVNLLGTSESHSPSCGSSEMTGRPGTVPHVAHSRQQPWKGRASPSSSQSVRCPGRRPLGSRVWPCARSDVPQQRAQARPGPPLSRAADVTELPGLC